MEACVFGCCDRMNFMITNVINRDFPGSRDRGSRTSPDPGMAAAYAARCARIVVLAWALLAHTVRQRACQEN